MGIWVLEIVMAKLASVFKIQAAEMSGLDCFWDVDVVGVTIKLKYF